MKKLVAMREIVRSQTAVRLKKLDRELRRVAHKPKDADRIHDLRVSIRRLSRELRVFRDWFDPEQVKRIRRRLRKLLDRCAAVRNCDIAIEVLGAAGWQSPALTTGLEKERKRARAELAGQLDRWHRRDRVVKWRKSLRVAKPPASAGHPDTAAENARRLLPPMIDELFRAGRDAARPGSSHHEMHQFRLKAKRMRYTLELFEPGYEGKIMQIMETLKGLQERLGAINDCATTLTMIRRDRDAAEAVRRLAGVRESEFREYWKKHFGVRESVGWKAVLGAADRNE